MRWTTTIMMMALTISCIIIFGLISFLTGWCGACDYHNKPFIKRPYKKKVNHK